MNDLESDLVSPGKEAVVYHPSKVSWAAADFIRKPPAYAAYVLVYAITLGLVLAVVYTYFAKIPVSVATSGVITTSTKPLPLISSSQATVVTLAVKENQRVKKGDTILITDSFISDADYRKLKGDVKALLALIKKDEKKRCDLKCKNRFATMSHSGFNIAVPESVKESVLQIKNFLNEFMLARESASNSSTSIAEQRRQIRVAQKQLETIRKNNAEKTLSTDVEALVAKIGSLKGSITQSSASSVQSIKASRERLKIRLGALLPTIDEFRSFQKITSPIDGTIVGLTINGEGQKISGGQTICQLVPENASLVAHLQVANREISKIQKNLPVKINLDALPDSEYGALMGRIKEIAAAPTTGASGGSTFLVTAELDKEFLKKGSQTFPVKYGMTLQAKVVTEKERILILGIKKILNIKDDIFGS